MSVIIFKDYYFFIINPCYYLCGMILETGMMLEGRITYSNTMQIEYEAVYIVYLSASVLTMDLSLLQVFSIYLYSIVGR